MQQRRTGKPLAHISPPQSSFTGMGSDSDRGSRLSQRSFGVTNRIWLIVVLFVFIISLTHYVLPATRDTAVRSPYSNLGLKSKNYLNSSETENPFDFCPVYGPGDAIGAKYGSLILSQSRLHLGSSARVQRVLTRAMAGQPVTISVIGGSGEFVASMWEESHLTQLICQSLLVMAQETILSLPNATLPSSSNGGTRSFHTLPPSSQMVQ